MTGRAKIWIASAITAAAAAVFARTLTFAAIYRPDPASTAVVTATAESKVAPAILASYPSKLIVPAAGVDAPFEDVGTTAAGNIGTPDNFTSVAWYDHSAIPGSRGTAIIDGHVDNGLGLSGVFKNLGRVVAGDKVEVIARSGEQLSFVVTNVATYPYDDTPSDVLAGPVGTVGSYIELITCGGTWLPAQKTYDHRLVVTAKLMNS